MEILSITPLRKLIGKYEQEDFNPVSTTTGLSAWAIFVIVVAVIAYLIAIVFTVMAFRENIIFGLVILFCLILNPVLAIIVFFIWEGIEYYALDKKDKKKSSSSRKRKSKRTSY